MEKQVRNEKQQGGYYFNMSKGEFLHLENRGVNTEDKLIKMPMAMLIMAGPLLGFAYVIFLPLAGILALFAYLGFKSKGFIWPLHRKHIKVAVSDQREADEQ